MEKDQYYWMRLCILSIVPFMILATLFWGILAYNIPPINGAISAADLARHFSDHVVRLRIGYGVAVPTWSLLMPWSVGMFMIMRRIEGSNGVLSYVQLVGGALTVVAPTMASIFWLTAAYRPETDPAIIQMLYDAGWLTIDLFFMVTTFQYCAAGIVFLKDPRERKLVPKWLLWLGIWIGLEFLAEIVMPHFRSGPFSWSGLFNYWVPFFGPFTWMMFMSYFLYNAVGRLEQEDRAKPALAKA